MEKWDKIVKDRKSLTESKEDLKMWFSLRNWKLIQWREIEQDVKFQMSGEP